MANQWLSLYLRDHHAASAGGVALARRTLGPHHTITRQIARDRKTLEDVMRQLNASPLARARLRPNCGASRPFEPEREAVHALPT
jgi:hypothetical protein